jgi:hypothetical protein
MQKAKVESPDRRRSTTQRTVPPVTPIGERAPGELIQSSKREFDEIRSAPGSDPDEIARWAVERVASAYPGDDSLAEIIGLQVVSWIRDERYSALDVKSAVIKALGREPQPRPGGFIGYVGGILRNPRPVPSSVPAPHFQTPPRPKLSREEFAEKIRIAREEDARKTGRQRP